MKNLVQILARTILFFVFLASGNLISQNPETSKKEDVYVDDKGISAGAIMM